MLFPMKANNSRVLVIDDNQPVRELITCMLISRGLQIMQADDGEKGINLALTAIPISFLPDTRLPNIDLLAVLAYLQQDPQTANIPVEEVLSFLLTYLADLCP